MKHTFAIDALEPRTLLAATTVGIYASLPDASETDGLGAGQGAFVVRRRTGPTADPLTFQYYVRNTSTAASGDDFRALSGTATIPAGKRTVTIPLNPDDDLMFEGDETVVVNLKTADFDIVKRSATITIADNDDPAPRGWWQSAWHYRVPITVNVAGYKRSEQPIERTINFTDVLEGLGKSGAVNPDSIRVVEVSSDGSQILDDDVPSQFDPSADFEGAANASGNLVFLLKGDTAGRTIRKFHVYFDTAADFPPAGFDLQVQVTDNVLDEGIRSLRIKTKTATYFYNKTAGAFSSILDSDGNDWVGWNSESNPGSAGQFRGIPNTGPLGFHAGQDQGITTAVVSKGPLKATLESIDSAGNKMRWEFFPTFARGTVLAANQNYYFMYEGTPGGSIDNDDQVVRSHGVVSWIGKRFKHPGGMGAGNGEEWVYFRDPKVGEAGRYLFLIHNTPDTIEDSYWLMDNNMTVFGFGRHNVPNFGDPLKLMSGQNVFTIGLADGGENFQASRVAINGAYRDVNVAIGKGRAI